MRKAFTALLISTGLLITSCGQTPIQTEKSMPSAELTAAEIAIAKENFWNFVKDDPDFKQVAQQLNIKSANDIKMSSIYTLNKEGKASIIEKSNNLKSQGWLPASIDLLEDMSAADIYLHFKAKPSVSCFNMSPYGAPASITYSGKFISPADQYGRYQVLGQINGTTNGSSYVSPGYVQFMDYGSMPQYAGDGTYLGDYNFKASCGNDKGWGFGTSKWYVDDTSSPNDYWTSIVITPLKYARPISQGDFY